MSASELWVGLLELCTMIMQGLGCMVCSALKTRTFNRLDCPHQQICATEVCVFVCVCTAPTLVPHKFLMKKKSGDVHEKYKWILTGRFYNETHRLGWNTYRSQKPSPDGCLKHVWLSTVNLAGRVGILSAVPTWGDKLVRKAVLTVFQFASDLFCFCNVLLLGKDLKVVSLPFRLLAK